MAPTEASNGDSDPSSQESQLGFDWLNEGATLRVCASCGIIDSYGGQKFTD